MLGVCGVLAATDEWPFGMSDPRQVNSGSRGKPAAENNACAEGKGKGALCGDNHAMRQRSFDTRHESYRSGRRLGTLNILVSTGVSRGFEP